MEYILPSSRFAREFHPHATHETYGPQNRSQYYISLKFRIKASYLSNLFDKSNKKALPLVRGLAFYCLDNPEVLSGTARLFSLLNIIARGVY